jgi:hypothetical protein
LPLFNRGVEPELEGLMNDHVVSIAQMFLFPKGYRRLAERLISTCLKAVVLRRHLIRQSLHRDGLHDSLGVRRLKDIQAVVLLARLLQLRRS